MNLESLNVKIEQMNKRKIISFLIIKDSFEICYYYRRILYPKEEIIIYSLNRFLKCGYSFPSQISSKDVILLPNDKDLITYYILIGENNGY